MAESSDESTDSTDIVVEPALFVCADHETNFEEKVHIDVTVLNVNHLDTDNELTSTTLFIHGLSFVVQVGRETKTSAKNESKSDKLKIQLKLTNRTSWSSRISVKLHASHPISFSASIEDDCDSKNNRIGKTFEWDVIAELKHFLFEIDVTAEFPNGGFVWPSREATGYSGIRNEGATCYVNSLLQSLFCTNDFRRIVYGLDVEPEDAKNSFVFWLKYIFHAMQFDGISEIRTTKLIKCFDWEEMTTTAQQDIHEFLRRLMDKLEQFVEGTEFKEYLTNMFVGELETKTTCRSIDYEKKQSEQFWDIQLPIEEDEDIFGAFQTYLQSLTISDYKHEDVNVEAVQEFRFTSMPPVLHIQLRRFKYDHVTNTVSKNNKRFQFYSKLDLTKYCAGAVYTLHSVLVHSGKTTSGHYMAYVSPKADGKWFKFNDETVTKCSVNAAIKSNYGNDDADPNAYILVYMKNSYIPQILRDIQLDDIASMDSIIAEIANEKIDKLFKQNHFEVVIYTPEMFQMNTKLKRGSQLYQSLGMTIFIGKEKTCEDLLRSLISVFHLGPDLKAIKLWPLTMKNGIIRAFDIDQKMDKKIRTLFRNGSVHFFMEIMPFEEPNFNEFDPMKHALIFIKEYTPSNKSLIFVGHRYFELKQTVQDIRAYIREITQYDVDNNEDIAIIEESGCLETYHQRLLNDSTELIEMFALNRRDTFSAMITFELLNTHRKPKYLSAFINFRPSISPISSRKIGSTLPATADPVNQIRKPVTTVSDPDNGIYITVNHEGKELFSQEFNINIELREIVEDLSEIMNITSDRIQLLDGQNNVIQKEFLCASIACFNKERNKTMRTRNQKMKGLVFSCKIIEEEQPSDIAEADYNMSTVNEVEAMDCEFQNDSMEPIGEEPTGDEPTAQKHLTPVSKTIDVQIENQQNPNDQTTIEFERTDIIQTVLCSFADRFEIELSDLEFSNVDTERITRSSWNCAIEQLIVNDMDHVKIFYIVKDKSIPTITCPSPVPISIVNDSGHELNNQKHSLMFEDRLRENTDMDLSFDGAQTLSTAIETISQVMDLDKSNVHFFNSKGEIIAEDLMNTSVSDFLTKHSPKIAYKKSDCRSIPLLCVHPDGTEAGMRHFSIDETKTVGQICEENCPKSLVQKVTRLLDGNINSIVPAHTKLVDLINDGYEYRINQCEPGILLNDSFNVCVSFLGKGRKNRLAILVEVSNGESLTALGMRLIKILSLNINPLKKFDFCVDPKWTYAPENDELILVAPNDPNEIPLVSVLDDI